MSTENLTPTPPETSSTSSTPPTSPTPAKPDPLTPVYAEKMELERFLRHGYNTGAKIAWLTVAGLLLFVGAMLYWNDFDYFPSAHNGAWLPYSTTILPLELQNQAQKTWAAYTPRPQVLTPPVERWQVDFYRKLRFDIYLIGAVVFVLGFIVAKIENAKAHRRELLILRALLREIERLKSENKNEKTK